MQPPKPPRPPMPLQKPGAGLPPPMPPGGRRPLVPPVPGGTLPKSPGEHQSADLGRVLARIEQKSDDMGDSKKLLEIS